jgi:hypothetical protein
MHRWVNRFKEGNICFMNGMDTQQLLVNAAPAKVTKEVERIKSCWGFA